MKWSGVIAWMTALAVVMALWVFGAIALVALVVLGVVWAAGASIQKRKRRQLQELRDSALW